MILKVIIIIIKLVSWFVAVMADTSLPHKHDAVDNDLQQERNKHGEGVL